MAWPEAVNTIVTQQNSWAELQYRAFGGTVDTYQRVHTRTVTEYVGGTESEATTYATNNPAGANDIIDCRAVKDGPCFWRVIKEVETVGAWTLI